MTPAALTRRQLGIPFNQVALASSYVTKNIEDESFTTTLYHADEDYLSDFALSSRFAAVITAAFELELWDLDERKKVFRVSFYPESVWESRVLIVRDKILCYGGICGQPGSLPENAAHLVSFETGEKLASLEHSEKLFDPLKLKVFEDRIFCPVKEGGVGEWDLDGKWIRVWKPENAPLEVKGLFIEINEAWICAVQDGSITLFSRKGKAHAEIHLETHYSKEVIIQKAAFSGESLALMLDFVRGDVPSRVLLIDFTLFPAQSALKEIEIEQVFFHTRHYLSELKFQFPYVFVGTTHGQALRYDLNDSTWQRVGNKNNFGHVNKIHFAPGYILSHNESIGSSDFYLSHPKTLKRLFQITYNGTGKAEALATKVCFLDPNSLIVWDFLPHPGAKRLDDVILYL